jgi:hypothetical protein
MGGYIECMGDMRNTYKMLVIELKGKRPLVRPIHGWGIILELE